jgi:RimJ/RimL family protein N-acetyltransferase
MMKSNPMTKIVRVLLLRLKRLDAPRLARSLWPTRVDQLLYAAEPNSYAPRSLARVDLAIRKKVISPQTVCYEARVDDMAVHRTFVRTNVLLPVQFGYDHAPVVGSCETIPEYRGLRIYPHVLSYALGDLRNTMPTGRVFIMVSPHNEPSIRGIERAGFELVARLRGIRLGPLILNRSGHRKQREVT